MTRLARTLALLTLILWTPAVARAGLAEEVDGLIRSVDLGSATIGVSIVEAGPGTRLVDRNGGEALIPASNLKLLTTGTALHALGRDFRFETKMIRDGDRLIVVGDGDPAFGDPALLEQMADGLSVEQFIDLWVRPIADSGTTRIRVLVIDDRIFDRTYVHPSWPTDQLNRRYCAQVSGLSFHLNILHFFPAPRGGERPSVHQVEPDVNWLSVKNRATSRTGPEAENTAWIARRLGTNELTFYGNVKRAYRVPVPVTIHDVPSFFGRLLADRLRVSGVAVETIRLAAHDEDEPIGEVAAPLVYSTLETVITRCNRDSQNLYAECLLKRIGHQMTGQAGSWLSGASIIRLVVHERLGDSGLASTLTIADGSGLSRNNRVTPRALTAWLNSFHNDAQLGEIYLSSLAVGGRSGTLQRRLRTSELHGAVVQAKSGYINKVSCLSGYVTASGGQRCCFSIMINDFNAPVSRAKTLQDRIVSAIARHLAAQPVQLGSD